jgi:glycosyltransferase involved in cell wall biosynthesis
MPKRLQILIITHYNIYPIESGGAVTLVAYIDELQKHHDISLILFHPFVPDEKSLRDLTQRWPNVRIFAGDSPVETLFIRCKKRVKNLIQRLGFFKPPVYSLEETSFIAYEPLRFQDSKLLNSVLEEKQFDLIEVNHSDQLGIVCFLPEDTPRFFVSHEPRFKRTEIQLERNMIDKFYGEGHYKYQLSLESHLMNKYDGVICLNENDAGYIRKYVDKPVFCSTFPVLNKDIADLKFCSQPPKTIFFLGMGNHYPNFDAVKYYKEHIGERVYKELGLKLSVYGEWDSGKIALLSCDFINFKGFVEDLNDIVADSIMLVPVRYGAGIRTKIQWAMAVGVPVVSTTFGFEGIPAVNNESILVADTPDSFFASIKVLKEDIDLYNRTRLNANQLVKDHFSSPAMISKRLGIYEEIIAEKLLNV